MRGAERCDRGERAKEKPRLHRPTVVIRGERHNTNNTSSLRTSIYGCCRYYYYRGPVTGCGGYVLVLRGMGLDNVIPLTLSLFLLLLLPPLLRLFFFFSTGGGHWVDAPA